MERTFAMLKPGVLQRGIVGEILSRIERKGLVLRGMKLMTIERALAERHYAEHKGKSFYENLIGYITSGPVLAMVIEGDNAVAVVRKLCGSTKVEDAAPGTIRGDYALHTSVNIIHASDSAESAVREIGLFFESDEIIDYEVPNATWI